MKYWDFMPQLKHGMAKRHYPSISVVNPDWDSVNDCSELEIWKYDPNALCQNGMVDPFSLVLSLKDAEDERVETAVMEFVEGLQR